MYFLHALWSPPPQSCIVLIGALNYIPFFTHFPVIAVN